MLFRCLNFSPPCAANAARASSIAVELAEIDGAAGIEFESDAAEPLDFAGAWANAVALSRSKTSVGVFFFMARLPPRSRIETAVTSLYGRDSAEVQKLNL